MPRDGGISNSKRNKTEASKESNAWLLKRLSDRTLPFIARSPVRARHLGEGSTRLARWVIGHGSMASTVSRSLSLPLLSRAFDYIRRKSTVAQPVWQRALELPWYHRHRKPRLSFTETTGTAADGRPAQINLQPGDEVDETYPALIKGLILPPVAGERPPATTRELPLRTRQTADRGYTAEATQPLHISRKEEPVHPVDETYPALIKGLILPPVAGERPPATTHELPHPARATSVPLGDKQVTGSLETEGAQGMPAQVDQQPRYIYQRQPLSQVLTRTQRMTLQGKYIEARPHITPESIRETPAFPILPTIHPKAIESEVESTGAVEKQPALPPLATAPEIELSYQPTVQPVHILRAPASYKQPATLPRKSSLGAPPDQIRPAIVKDTLKEPGPSIIQRTAKYISELASKPFLPEILTYREGTAAPPIGVSYQWAPQIGQAWRQRPLVGPSVEPAGQQADITYQTKAITDLSQSSDMLSLPALEPDRTGQGFAEGRGDKPPFYREPFSVGGPPAKPLLVPLSIQRMMTLPSLQLFKSRARTPLPDRGETYEFPWDQEYAPSVPGYDYTRQPALELPVTSSIQPKAEPGTARSEELLTDIPYTTPGLTYSRDQNVPELALARVSRGSETTVFRAEKPEMRTEGPAEAPEPRREKPGEKVAEPNIDAIASDVYRILRRRLISERERTFGVT